MIILSDKEVKYLIVKGMMYKYLRYFNKFSKDDEPLMVYEQGGKKRIGTCKTGLVCLLQGPRKLDSFERYVKDTPYESSQEWIDDIDKLYGDKNMHNGYIFLLTINQVSISPINMHPSCHDCVKIMGCGLYKDLKDAYYCEDRISNIELDNPIIVFKKYRSNLYILYQDLDKLRELENRNDIIIKITGLMEDIRRYLYA